jgi:hypothetical protein
MGAVLAWAYVRFGATPNVDLVLSGFNAAVVGLIIAITFKMVATSIARIWQMGVAAAALLLSFAGNAPPAEVVVIGVALGLGADFAEQRRVLARRGARKPKPPVALPDDGTVLPRAAPQPDDPRAPPREPGKLRVPIAVALLAAAWLSPTLRDHVRAYVAFFRTGLGAHARLRLRQQRRDRYRRRDRADHVALRDQPGAVPRGGRRRARRAPRGGGQRLRGRAAWTTPKIEGPASAPIARETGPLKLERNTRFELATFALARRRSTN